MSEIKVFISYSHDSEAHRENVLRFSERLRADGIETLLDQYVNGSPVQGWPRWMLDQIDAATYVLVICTETYYRRFRGHEEPGKGKGVDWEGAVITQEIYNDNKTLKFVAVFLDAASEQYIPEPLRWHTHYAITSEDVYQRLYDFLLQRAGVEPGTIGTLKTAPRRTATALTFDKPIASDSTPATSRTNTNDATKPIDVPVHLRCCLLIKEGLAHACSGAGGGPSTRLHRLLDLATRWTKEGQALLPECHGAFDSQLVEILTWLCTEIILSLIAEARHCQPAPGDGDSDRRDNEFFKQVRNQAYQEDSDLDRTLNADPAFVALTKSKQKWPILGFPDEAAYNDFLSPTVQTLARNPNPMQHDLFARLIAQPEFSPRQLADEGYRQDLVMDTVNALLTVDWAKWTDLNELGSKAKGTMTPVGNRLLRQFLLASGSHIGSTASQNSSAESPGDSLLKKEPLTTWKERLAFLRREEAIVSDSAQKFTLEQQIEEAQTKIRALEAER